MVTIIKFNPAQWSAMLALKSGLKFMRENNEFLPEMNQGRYDRALKTNTNAYKYFLKEALEKEVA